MSNELAKKEEGGVPAHLKTNNKEDLGINGIKPQDIVLPRIKIVQQSSRAAKKANSELKEGMYYDSLNFKSLGPKISFFPVLLYSSLVWFDKDTQRFMGGEKEDIITGKKVFFGDEEWCKNHEPKESFNYMIALESELKVAVKNKQPLLPTLFSCVSSARTNARKLNSKIWTNAVELSIPIYGQLVTSEVEEKEFSGKGVAYNPKFKYGRYATKEEAEYLKALHKKCLELQSVVQEHQDEKPASAPKPAAVEPADDDEEVPF